MFGPFGPVTQSTSDVGAPAIWAGGAAASGAGCGAAAGGAGGAALGRNGVAFGDCGSPGTGGFGAGGGTTPACGTIGAEYRWPAPVGGLINEAISGPNLGSGAESFACEGRRPVGGWTTG
ncbi:hypothetical protein AWC05_19775 [Mycobacterium florentinum]|uniref:Uncharacterized protein n=1 Tax=Mycobacterium florentinum TaxID=292462 RepID=A0A1X1UA25_MYCFL|nr:hypothetical protein AWC05_19775 [Mycobacterium florentinum]